ncbi:hypothetical protein [Streptomyces virginiae]|uniref:Uncharacterized protein n=1 Tax=Streptomyces virginiae TaxID=1961 RepID=A0ABZ1TRK2_STRVG|nr:hypothetical protein [Streptomyces virginiae]
MSLAVLGEVRVSDRFRSGSGGLRVPPAWPARRRDTATTGAPGVVRQIRGRWQGPAGFRYLAAGDYWFNDETAGDKDGPHSRLRA